MDNMAKSLLLTPFNALYKVNPRLTLELIFRMRLGYPLNLDDPKTFNEKLQWIKLNDHNPLMALCCDKYEVRDFVRARGCGDYLSELLWEGFNPEEIPFDDLPDKFVMKATHGSTFNIICTDKSKLDREKAVRTLSTWLKAKFIPCYGEWFYGMVPPRVIVEEFLDDGNSGGLTDYKFYCFNGEPRLARVMAGRSEGLTSDFYDCDWNYQEGYQFRNYNAKGPVDPPESLSQMLEIARKLSEPFSQVRVDLYEVGGSPVFGELTFTNGAGFSKMHPDDLDLRMGEWLDLTKTPDYTDYL